MAVRFFANRGPKNCTDTIFSIFSTPGQVGLQRQDMVHAVVAVFRVNGEFIIDIGMSIPM
jgi:hypothetical protein